MGNTTVLILKTCTQEMEGHPSFGAASPRASWRRRQEFGLTARGRTMQPNAGSTQKKVLCSPDFAPVLLVATRWLKHNTIQCSLHICQERSGPSSIQTGHQNPTGSNAGVGLEHAGTEAGRANLSVTGPVLSPLATGQKETV
ncbi:hypothetical protein N7539_002571 [Penicillium diatomitis]|uniref:Uncharacterized protein n=1 Tax=Penicillium diatomitis TaxID=2819901 RepID=A0A9W9XEW9_9EURO|nr:uncharacterized protein N7539_002571 [Penicillium diatomitis]KAJ5491004.1 hypothetical protein N7539_002571 [Penicillium diatomitis]